MRRLTINAAPAAAGANDARARRRTRWTAARVALGVAVVAACLATGCEQSGGPVTSAAPNDEYDASIADGTRDNVWCASDEECPGSDEACVTWTCDTDANVCVEVQLCRRGGSCADRCGDFSAEQSCACDELCEEYDDCCDDFKSLCSGCSDAAACDDGDPCTTDSCEADGTCKNVAISGCVPPEVDAGPTVPAAQSCVDRCGEYDESAQCQCDFVCSEYGDCCENMETVCGNCGDDEDCDDGDSCTTDSCDEGTSVCQHVVISGCVPVDAAGADAAGADAAGTDAAGTGTLTDGATQPAGTCAGKCGVYDGAASCQCDETCTQYGDCCADHAKLCGGCSDLTDCSDGDLCTADLCVDGQCKSIPLFGCIADAGAGADGGAADGGAADGGGAGDGGISDAGVDGGSGDVSDGGAVSGGSCANKCGTYDGTAACQCDAECKGYGDCCADIDAVCGQCKADKDCDDNAPCTVDSCTAGVCSNVTKADCGGVTLPFIEPFDCASGSSKLWFTAATSGSRWAVDASPASPLPASAACSLNFNDGAQIACKQGLKASGTIVSPWIEVGALPAGTPLRLTAAVGGLWTGKGNGLLTIGVTNSATGWKGPQWQAKHDFDGSYKQIALDLTAGWAQAPKGTTKLQVSIQFETADCDQALPGPFIDDLHVFAVTGGAICDDGNACTKDSYSVAKGACQHAPIAGCSSPVCGDGTCATSEKGVCPDDCGGSACAAGVCCDLGKKLLAASGVPCGEQQVAKESKCVGAWQMHRAAVAGCSGTSIYCSTDASHLSWSDWAWGQKCPTGTSCVVAGGHTSCAKQAGCAASDGPCCDGGALSLLPQGSKCGASVVQTVGKCVAGAVWQRQAWAGCSGGSATCSASAGDRHWSDWQLTTSCTSAGKACVEAGGGATCQQPAGCKGICCAGGKPKPAKTACGSQALATEGKCQSGAVWRRQAVAGCDPIGVCSVAAQDRSWSAWKQHQLCASGTTCKEDNGAAACVPSGGCSGVCCDPTTGAAKAPRSLCGTKVLSSKKACSGNEIVVHKTYAGCTGASTTTCSADMKHRYSAPAESVSTCPTGKVCSDGACVDPQSGPDLEMQSFERNEPFKLVLPGQTMKGTMSWQNVGDTESGPYMTSAHVGTLPNDTTGAPIQKPIQLKSLKAGEKRSMGWSFKVPTLKYGHYSLTLFLDSNDAIKESLENNNKDWAPFVVGECAKGGCCDVVNLKRYKPQSNPSDNHKCSQVVAAKQTQCLGTTYVKTRFGYRGCSGKSDDCSTSPAHYYWTKWSSSKCPSPAKCKIVDKQAKCIAGPDLQPTYLSVPKTIKAGKSVSSTVIVKNFGGTPSGNFKDAFYLSKYSSIWPPKKKLASSGRASLKANQQKTYFFNKFMIPADTKPGYYYLHYVVDDGKDVKETDENDNSKSVKIKVTVSDSHRPDLVAKSMKPSKSTWIVGQKVTGSYERQNAGKYASGVFYDAYYLSKNSSNTSSKTLLSKKKRPSLKAGGSVKGTLGLVLPKKMKGGSWYLHYVVDDGDKVDESKEYNNRKYSKINVVECATGTCCGSDKMFRAKGSKCGTTVKSTELLCSKDGKGVITRKWYAGCRGDHASLCSSLVSNWYAVDSVKKCPSSQSCHKDGGKTVSCYGAELCAEVDIKQGSKTSGTFDPAKSFTVTYRAKNAGTGLVGSFKTRLCLGGKAKCFTKTFSSLSAGKTKGYVKTIKPSYFSNYGVKPGQSFSAEFSVNIDGKIKEIGKCANTAKETVKFSGCSSGVCCATANNYKMYKSWYSKSKSAWPGLKFSSTATWKPYTYKSTNRVVCKYQEWLVCAPGNTNRQVMRRYYFCDGKSATKCNAGNPNAFHTSSKDAPGSCPGDTKTKTSKGTGHPK